ncbi:hypothetical protein ACP4OV_001121 [Aristida adscensionis]
MAKPSAGVHTPRPTSLRSAAAAAPASAPRTSVGSSSSAAAATKLPVAAAAAIPRDLVPSTKVVAKCLKYDDDLALPAAAAAAALSLDALPEGLAAQEDHFAPLLAMPDPEVSGDSSTSVVSAPSDDAVTASTDSCVTEVAVRAGTDAPLPEQISLVLEELHAADGLSPRSKRLLSALAEAATAELAPAAAAARRLRRAAFWGKVRVAVLATTVAAVAAVDIALAAYLYARRVSDRHHALPPT